MVCQSVTSLPVLSIQFTLAPMYVPVKGLLLISKNNNHIQVLFFNYQEIIALPIADYIYEIKNVNSMCKREGDIFTYTPSSIAIE